MTANGEAEVKLQFRGDVVDGRALVLCTSDEERCAAVASKMKGGTPSAVIVLDYCGSGNRWALEYITSKAFDGGVERLNVVKCTGTDAVDRLRQQIDAIQKEMASTERELVIDFSVMPRPDLWLLLRWIVDAKLWDRTVFVYSEPEDYSSVKSIPLSCGLQEIQTLVGEAGVADCSRPLHLVMQLGYEGDQALAVYEETQPARVTLLIPHPPFRSEWIGRTQKFNSHLLGLVGEDACLLVDAIDPEVTANVVKEIVAERRFGESTIVCPLGTKPQLLGLFSAAVSLSEEPALLIPKPLRAASVARAKGVGQSWIVK